MQVELDEAESKALLTRLLGGKLPDEHGRFGPFGGRYAPETLVPALQRLEEGVDQFLKSPEFIAELNRELEQPGAEPEWRYSGEPAAPALLRLGAAGKRTAGLGGRSVPR